MQPFAIAGIQMQVSAHEENVSAMRHRLDLLMARFPWVQMVLFSELAPFGPMTKFAVSLPGPTEAAMADMAKHYGIWLVPGSMFEQVEDKVYNTSSVFNPEGEVVGRYRKMFPFRPYESVLRQEQTSWCSMCPTSVGSAFQFATISGSRKRHAR